MMLRSFFIGVTFVIGIASFFKSKQKVDFHSRMLAFRGAGGEPPRLRLRGLTCPAIPAGVEHPFAPINLRSMYLYTEIK
jgi:hypothetical protein